MKAKKLLALAGVSVAGAFLLAACGGGSSNQATYSFVYSADPNTLDYIAATRTTTSDVTSNLVDGLLENDRYGNFVPSLAGVGRKTANVVMSVGFGIPAFAVDTHVERICKHHDIVKKSATPLEVEKRVMDVLPKSEWLAAHQAMIYFGRAICHPKNPECDQYPQLYHFD